MIEARDDLFMHQLIKAIKIDCTLPCAAGDGDQDDIIVPMPIWIIAFAEGSPILFGRELICVEPMSGAKTIAPGHMYL